MVQTQWQEKQGGGRDEVGIVIRGKGFVKFLGMWGPSFVG